MYTNVLHKEAKKLDVISQRAAVGVVGCVVSDLLCAACVDLLWDAWSLLFWML